MMMENFSGEVPLLSPPSLSVVSSALEQHQCQLLVICASSSKHSYCAMDQLSSVTSNAAMTNLEENTCYKKAAFSSIMVIRKSPFS